MVRIPINKKNTPMIDNIISFFNMLSNPITFNGNKYKIYSTRYTDIKAIAVNIVREINTNNIEKNLIAILKI